MELSGVVFKRGFLSGLADGRAVGMALRDALPHKARPLFPMSAILSTQLKAGRRFARAHRFKMGGCWRRYGNEQMAPWRRLRRRASLSGCTCSVGPIVI